MNIVESNLRKRRPIISWKVMELAGKDNFAPSPIIY
jgi:hypothetical protein